ncbi:hypothetical protein IE81DRAFT_62343 [Ceraceosorus guamensis]|uniref:Uncharacterized protein n=1 Tax=Ceraceosorus guamensis TaxID=1522189 RepID=A0A316W2G7_9BASI|nr:hypothetical protein IE81DRAFT_62343 [Ceraceosorus guamensis]PWN43879.1 hypothetical protein IE81DRAFT_62343 [Ceraceosorus guamensis]
MLFLRPGSGGMLLTTLAIPLYATANSINSTKLPHRRRSLLEASTPKRRAAPPNRGTVASDREHRRPVGAGRLAPRGLEGLGRLAGEVSGLEKAKGAAQAGLRSNKRLREVWESEASPSSTLSDRPGTPHIASRPGASSKERTTKASAPNLGASRIKPTNQGRPRLARSVSGKSDIWGVGSTPRGKKARGGGGRNADYNQQAYDDLMRNVRADPRAKIPYVKDLPPGVPQPSTRAANRPPFSLPELGIKRDRKGNVINAKDPNGKEAAKWGSAKHFLATTTLIAGASGLYLGVHAVINASHIPKASNNSLYAVPKGTPSHPR